MRLVYDEQTSKFSYLTFGYYVSRSSFLPMDPYLVYADILSFIPSENVNSVKFYYNSSQELLVGSDIMGMDFDLKNISYIPVRYTLSTLKNTSLFHNTIKYKLRLPQKWLLGNDFYTCFFVYQPINEDIFVEQQETRKVIEKNKVLNSLIIENKSLFQQLHRPRTFFRFCRPISILLYFLRRN
jgi:hypothetical protein